MPTTTNLKLPYPVEAAPADVPVDIQALAEAMDAYGLSFATPGDMKISAAIAAPAGWLLCDGRAVSRSTYSALFAAIGTSFGAGDGSTTFALPDCRGRSLIGAGAGTGLTARTLGATGGEEAHVVSAAELPSHAHSISDPTHAHNLADPGHNHGHNLGGAAIYNTNYAGGAIGWGGTGNSFYRVDLGLAGSGTGMGVYGASTGITGTAAAGGGAAHNNMEPFVAVNVLIKT